MAPPSPRTVAPIETVHGFVALRGLFAPKQGSHIAVLSGKIEALRILLPTWRPRSPDKQGVVRAQITPDKPIGTIDGINEFITSLVPRFRELAAAANNPFVATGTSPPASASYRTLGEVIELVSREVAPTVRAISARTYARQYSASGRRDEGRHVGLPVTSIAPFRALGGSRRLPRFLENRA